MGLGAKADDPGLRHAWTRQCERWLGEHGFGK
jgi:hypothetical protein